MTLDGSAFKKPQIGPCYDDVNKENEKLLQNLYKQEHFLPIVESGILKLATSKTQLIEHVNEALENPASFTENGDKILKEIIGYTDGCCTERVAEVIKNFLGRQPVELSSQNIETQ